MREVDTECYLKVEDLKVHTFSITGLLFFLKNLFSHLGSSLVLISNLMTFKKPHFCIELELRDSLSYIIFSKLLTPLKISANLLQGGACLI